MPVASCRVLIKMVNNDDVKIVLKNPPCRFFELLCKEGNNSALPVN